MQVDCLLICGFQFRLCQQVNYSGKERWLGLGQEIIVVVIGNEVYCINKVGKVVQYIVDYICFVGNFKFQYCEVVVLVVNFIEMAVGYYIGIG